ncbi:hypothetical protein EJ03DRAFT_124631 [Teratosphaeria nubilosa]|uniref:Uncharacterized protein n=1 Tax=Teratosphaeria nubilosa TaxID=161662 RepID=A0A6G1LKV9_9PEZI|nr:hypothetical protein EJ03DRAFT_124631 [Teratosphaeria nubilosa]
MSYRAPQEISIPEDLRQNGQSPDCVLTTTTKRSTGPMPRRDHRTDFASSSMALTTTLHSHYYLYGPWSGVYCICISLLPITHPGVDRVAIKMRTGSTLDEQSDLQA